MWYSICGYNKGFCKKKRRCREYKEKCRYFMAKHPVTKEDYSDWCWWRSTVAKDMVNAKD